MKSKRDHVRCGFFSIAFGIIVIAVGISWLLQVIGIMPADIEILHFACPLCVILFGVSILTSRTHRRNQNQEIAEDGNGKM
jgi:hypothetical protein